MSEPDPDERAQRRARRLEDAFVILCIFTLWPVIMGWRHPAFQFAMYVALVGLLVVFFRRLKRIREARRPTDD
jgi:hypothetical protein